MVKRLLKAVINKCDECPYFFPKYFGNGEEAGICKHKEGKIIYSSEITSIFDYPLGNTKSFDMSKTPPEWCPLPSIENTLGVQVGAVAVICKGRKFLSGLRIGDRTMTGSYALPGGKMDYTEHDPKETVQRESKEEAGIVIKNPKLLGTIDEFFPDRNMHYYVFYYLITEWNGEITNMEPEKCTGWEWVDPNNMPSNFSPYAQKIIANHKEEILSIGQ